MIKRKIHFLFLLLPIFILIIGLVPFIAGIFFEKKYYHFVDIVNHDNEFNIAILEYHRGWLHSRAKIRVTINKKLINFYFQTLTQQASAPISFIIEENIIHGPLVFDRIKRKLAFGYANIQSNIFLADAFRKTLPNMFKGPEIMYVDMLSEFDGDWSGHIKIPPLAFAADTLGSVTWGGMNSDFKIIIRNEHITHVKSQTSIGLLVENIKNTPIAQIIIQPIYYKYDVARQETGLWSGETYITTSGLNILRSNGAMIASNKIEVQSTFSVDQEAFYNTNLNITISHLKISNYFIPDISLFSLMLSANNFSTRGLNEYLSSFVSGIVNLFDANKIENLLTHTIMNTSTIHGNVTIAADPDDLSSLIMINWLTDKPAPNHFSDIATSIYAQFDVTASPSLATKLVAMSVKGINELKFQLFGEKIPDMPLPPKPMMPSPTAQALASESPQQLVNDLVKIGYLGIDNKKNYYTRFTIENGVPKINGRALTTQ